jgi:hypothetical protein
MSTVVAVYVHSFAISYGLPSTCRQAIRSRQCQPSSSFLCPNGENGQMVGLKKHKAW